MTPSGGVAMQSYWLGFTRKFTTLVAFLLLAACGGGDGSDAGNAARDGDSKGGPTAGAAIRGGGAPIESPIGNTATGSGQAGGALSVSVPGVGAASSGASKMIFELTLRRLRAPSRRAPG